MPKQLSKFPSSTSLAGDDLFGVFLPLPASNDNLWRPFDRDDQFTVDPDLRRFQDPDECRHLFYSERGEHESIFPADLTYSEYDAVYNKLARLSLLLDGADKHLHITEIERAIMNAIGGSGALHQSRDRGSGTVPSSGRYQGSVVNVYIANKNGYKHILPSGCVKCVVTVWTKGTFGRDCLRPIESLIDFCDRGMLRVLGRTLRVIQVAAPPVLNSFVNCIAEYRSLKSKESGNANVKKEVDVKLGGGLNLEKVKGAWKKPLPPEHFISSMDNATAALMSGSETDDKTFDEKVKDKEKLEIVSSVSTSPAKTSVSPTMEDIAAKFPTQQPPTRTEEVTDNSSPMDVDFVSSPSVAATVTPPAMNDTSISTEPLSNDLLSPSDMDLNEPPQEMKENPLLALSPDDDDDDYDEDTDEGDLHTHSDKSGKFVEIVSEFTSPVGSVKAINAAMVEPPAEVSPPKVISSVETVAAPVPQPTVPIETTEPVRKTTSTSGPTKPVSKAEQQATFAVPIKPKSTDSAPPSHFHVSPTKAAVTKPKTLVFPDEKDSAPNIMDTMPDAAPLGLIRPEFHYERLTDSVVNDCLLPLFTQHQALQNSILLTMQQIVAETLVKQCLTLPDAILQNMPNSMPPLPKPLFTPTSNSNINTNTMASPAIGGNKSLSHAPRNAHLIFYHDHRIVSVISPYFKYRVHAKDDATSGSSSPCSNIQSYYGFLLAPHDHLEDIWYTLCRIRRKVFVKKQKQVQLEQQMQRQRLKRSSASLLNRSRSMDPEASTSKLIRSNSLSETNNSTTNINGLDDSNMMYVDSNYDDGVYENDEDDDAYAQAPWFDEEEEEDDNDDSNVDNAMTEKERLENTLLAYLQRATSVVVKLYTDANNCTIDTGAGTGPNGNVCSPNSAFCSLTQETMSRNMRGRPGILEYLYIGKYAYPLPTPQALGNAKSNLSNANLIASTNNGTNNLTNTANINAINNNNITNVPAASPMKPQPRSKKDYRDILVTELPVLTLRQIIDYFAENYPIVSNNSTATGNANTTTSVDNDFNLAEAKFKLAKAMCLAVSTLHVGENMIHRDLRPENCVIMSDGTLRLSDFNLAKRVLITSMNNNMNAFLNSGGSGTHSSAVYLAPEVVSSLPAGTNLTAVDDRFVIVTKAGDIYALGSILYEIFTHGESVSILHLKKLHHPFFYLQHPDRMPNVNTSSTNNIAVTVNTASTSGSSSSNGNGNGMSYSSILNSNKSAAAPAGLPPLHPPNSGTPSSSSTTIVPINNSGNTLWPPLAHVYLYLHQPWLLHLLFHCLEEDPAQRPNVTQILRHPWFLTFSLNFDVLLVRELNEVLIRDYHAVYDANFVKRLRLLKPIESMLNFTQLDAKSAAKVLASSSTTSSYGKKDSKANVEEDSNSLSSYYYRHHPAGTWVNDMNATQITSFITLGHEYSDLLPDMIHFPSVAATATGTGTNKDTNSSSAGDDSSVASSPFGGLDSGSVRLSKSGGGGGGGSGTMKRSRSRSTSVERNLSGYGSKYSSSDKPDRGSGGGGGGKGGDRDVSRERGGDRGSERDRDRDRDRSRYHGGHRDYDDGDLYYDDRSYHRGRTDSRDRDRDRGGDRDRDRGGDRGGDRGRDRDDGDDYHARRHSKSSYMDADSEPPTPPPPPRATSSAYSTSSAAPTSGSEVLFVPYPLPKLSLFLRFVRNLKTHYHGLEDLQRLMRASKQHVLLPMRALLKTTYAFYHSHYNPATAAASAGSNEAAITNKMGEVLDEYVRFFQEEKLTYDYPADIFTHHPAINWLLPEIWRQSVRQYRQWKKEGEEIEARRQQELSEINVFANL